jgi:hypothetical protein
MLVACDVSEEWTSVARRYWAEAGVADKIALHLAPAIETLDALLRDGQAGTFDFAFIGVRLSRSDAEHPPPSAVKRSGMEMGELNNISRIRIAFPAEFCCIIDWPIVV